MHVMQMLAEAGWQCCVLCRCCVTRLSRGPWPFCPAADKPGHAQGAPPPSTSPRCLAACASASWRTCRSGPTVRCTAEVWSQFATLLSRWRGRRAGIGASPAGHAVPVPPESSAAPVHQQMLALGPTSAAPVHQQMLALGPTSAAALKPERQGTSGSSCRLIPSMRSADVWPVAVVPPAASLSVFCTSARWAASSDSCKEQCRRMEYPQG